MALRVELSRLGTRSLPKAARFALRALRCPRSQLRCRGTEQLCLQKVFDHVDHHVDIITSWLVSPMCRGVPHVEGGLEHFALPTSDQPALYE